MKKIIVGVIIALFLILGGLFFFQYKENSKEMENEIYISEVTNKKIIIPGDSKFISEESNIIKFTNTRNFEVLTKEIAEIMETKYEKNACNQYYNKEEDIVIEEFIAKNDSLFVNSITIRYSVGMECGV